MAMQIALESAAWSQCDDSEASRQADSPLEQRARPDAAGVGPMLYASHEGPFTRLQRKLTLSCT